MTEIERLQALADENDGHAKRHAYEVNCLREEVAMLRDTDALAHELASVERDLEREREHYRHLRKSSERTITDLRARLARADRENSLLDAALFRADCRPSSVPPLTGTPNG